MTYFYWTLQWVPDVVRGEFVNIGVLVGEERGRDWAFRHVSSFQRANSIGGDAGRAQSYLNALRDRVAKTMLPPSAMWEARPLSFADVESTRAHQSNSLRLAPPRRVVAASAEAALELVYPLMVEEPPVSRRLRTRDRVVRTFRQELERSLPLEDLTYAWDARATAGSQRGRFDVVLQNDERAQLGHAWSFQARDAAKTAESTAAWAWFIERFRTEGATILTAPKQALLLPRQTHVIVVHDEPTSDEQHANYRAALEAWRKLDIEARPTAEVRSAAEDVREHLDLVA